MKNRALVMVNTGTPDSPSVSDVKKFLREFLSDPDVIDLNPLLRTILVNLVIVPFRARYSSGLYKRLWKDGRSPLLVNLKALEDKTSVLLKDYDIYTATRYGNPSLSCVLEELFSSGYPEVVILPLFPQYASSTTGSVVSLVRQTVVRLRPSSTVRFITQFYSSPAFVRYFADAIRPETKQPFDAVVFSYHGLPERHIRKEHPGCDPGKCRCDIGLPERRERCYRAACFETSRLIAFELGLSQDQYRTSFQSRLGRKWLEPFTDAMLESLAAEKARRVIIAAPSFVADCLETTVEIGGDYASSFRKRGGGELVVIKAPNADLDVAGILGLT